MTLASNFDPLQRAALIQPTDIFSSVEQLQAKSRQCSDLAATCLTQPARDALLAMADQFRAEAEALELTLQKLSELCAQTRGMRPGADPADE